MTHILAINWSCSLSLASRDETLQLHSVLRVSEYIVNTVHFTHVNLLCSNNLYFACGYRTSCLCVDLSL